MIGMDQCPAFIREDIDGNISRPDREWFYHFLDDGYEKMKSVEIIPDSFEQSETIEQILAQIGLAGCRTKRGIKVYGYTLPGEQISRFQ